MPLASLRRIASGNETRSLTTDQPTRWPHFTGICVFFAKSFLWHDARYETTVNVAMPYCQGRVSPALDFAARLLVARVEDGKEVSRQEVTLAEDQPNKLAAHLTDLGVNVLICGAVSQPLAGWLAKAGVQVLPHVCGEADAVLIAFLRNTLDEAEFRMPGCYAGRCGWHKGRLHRRGNPWRHQTNSQSNNMTFAMTSQGPAWKTKSSSSSRTPRGCTKVATSKCWSRNTTVS
jgi:predicted Fe-Mo cluster-binding NifX family protein